MLTLVRRRAVVQRRLLTSVLLLVATASTLVGVCTLMLGVTEDRAFHVEVQRSPPADLSVTAYLVELRGGDVAPARTEASRVVEGVLAPLRPRLETVATSPLRELDGGERQAYLTMSDALSSRAGLTSGRWPVPEETGAVEAVVPTTTARTLGIDLGDEVRLGAELGLDGADDPITVVVVGTFDPRADAGWDGDPLAGAGYSPAYSDGLEAAPTYGPFVIPETSFLASGTSVRGMRVTAHPTPELAADASLRAAVDSLDEASGLLASRVGDRARITRVGSELPATLDRLHAQQAGTRATVLVVLVLGLALALAAALLAGWLVASAREDERDLLQAMGLSRRQELAAAGVEALLLSCVASTIAVPTAAVVHSRLTHLADLEAAGLRQGPSLTWGLVLATLAAAVLLAAALVMTAVSARPAPGPTSRRGVGVRLGVGAALLAAAGVAWWQVRAQPATTAGSVDVMLTLAPVLCIAALTGLGVRVVPLVLGAAAQAGTRSRSLVWPLAARQAARRAHTGTAMVLVAAAVASAVFGLALRTTWERSQDDQAALRVGTDLAITLPVPAGQVEADRVDAAVRTGDAQAPVVSAVIHRPLTLGRYVGQPGSRPVLVALDTTRAGALLRGRTDAGRSWSELSADLAPDGPSTSLPLPADGAGVRLRGRSPSGAALTVTATAVVEDPTGFRSTVPAESLPLDGASHLVRWVGPVDDGLRLVGLRLVLDGDPGAARTTRATVRIGVTIPSTGEAPADGPDWQLLPLLKDSPVAGATVRLRPTDDATEVLAELGLNLDYFAYTGADLLATAFPVPEDVPVVVSQDLVDAVGSRVGDELSAIVGDTALPLRVVRVVPTVPSAPGQVAVLADADTLSRALIDAGRLDPVVDAWWVARPTSAVAGAVRALELGDVTVREEVAQQLAQGPLRVTAPTTLLALVALAVALLLAAVALVLGGERQRRSAEVVRLRALGLSPRDARRLLVTEHLAFLVPLVVVGALVGVGATLLIAPHLVRSDLGTAPVPPAIVAWPWTAELLLVGGMLLATIAITVVVTGLHVRRSAPARLGEGQR